MLHDPVLQRALVRAREAEIMTGRARRRRSYLRAARVLLAIAVGFLARALL